MGSIFAFSQALRLFGIRASAFSSATPGVAALLAIPVLGQIPDTVEVVALLVVMIGLGIASHQHENGPSQRRQDAQALRSANKGK